MRDSEGYVKTWYDSDNDDGKAKIFKFAPKKVNGTIYVTVENYPYGVVPERCGNNNYAYANLAVWNNKYVHNYRWYDWYPLVISIPTS